MLARVEATAPRAGIEIDRSGTLVRVRPSGEAPAVVAALEEEGLTCERLEGAKAREAEREAERWFSRATIAELTKEEFRILSREWTDELRGSVLDAREADALAAALAGAFDAAIDDAPPASDVAQDVVRWRAKKLEAIDAALARVTLAADVRARVREHLASKL